MDINSKLDNTVDLSNTILTHLDIQNESIINSLEKSKGLNNTSKDSYKTIKSIYSTSYRWWLWFTSFIPNFDYIINKPNEPSLKMIDSYVPNNNTTLDRLNIIYSNTEKMNSILDDQNQKLDKLYDNNIKTEEYIKKSNKIMK